MKLDKESSRPLEDHRIVILYESFLIHFLKLICLLFYGTIMFREVEK